MPKTACLPWRAQTSLSLLCSSQESSAPKSLGARDSLQSHIALFTAQTRGGWIPVTSVGQSPRKGMREVEERASLSNGTRFRESLSFVAKTQGRSKWMVTQPFRQIVLTWRSLAPL
ncbi:hypothetical protein B5E41_05315 [Rhizobium esperanzae]|uniref:Uncharacterized protein n=1 Tax=Rhizobium esperanzae TaxID=1967781 RepID=A0A2D0AB06_9HYPH|nr:hypothetical protein B5E41_05315 [Rhizobium esperanzae]